MDVGEVGVATRDAEDSGSAANYQGGRAGAGPTWPG
jgi:hypothetical protein